MHAPIGLPSGSSHAPPPASTSPRAASSRVSASSTSSTVMTSGGKSWTTVSAVRSTTTPGQRGGDHRSGVARQVEAPHESGAPDFPLLRAYLTPNAAMEAGYRTFRVETRMGEVVDGLGSTRQGIYRAVR